MHYTGQGQAHPALDLPMIEIRLKPGREKSVLRRHPWVFSGAIDSMNGTPQDGETVELLDSKGRWLARGAYSASSQLRVRIWSWDAAERIEREFFHRRLKSAIAFRQRIINPEQTNACRLVHAESDGLPGLIVDQYQQAIVVQFLSCGAERWREVITEILEELLHPELIYERSDVEVRKLEGLSLRTGVLHGQAPVGPVTIFENGCYFEVDLCSGQKTGFYLDQRVNRQRAKQLARERSVLDCFSYTGGFTISALMGGAQSVVAVEASEAALKLARENVALNGLDSDRVEWIEGDVFQVLRRMRDQGRRFDLVIVDPPKFAISASQAGRAARGYKDVNLLAFKLLNPEGILVTFSCSGVISLQLFQSIVAGAALDAGVDARLVEVLTQAPDHPVALNFPESAYLKGLVVAV